MVTLSEVLKQADTQGIAIGHFNVSDLVTLKAVFEAAHSRNVPVVIGVSESERRFLGVRQIALMVKSLQDEYGSLFS
jgi:fructose-bisphosphate aldolase, class II